MNRFTTLFIVFFLVSTLISDSTESDEALSTLATKEKAPQCGIAVNTRLQEDGVTIVGSKIVGGNVTSVNLFPWFAALAQRQGSRGYQVFCGSTLISPDRVVTAAHCYDGNSPRESRFLIVFDLNNRFRDPGQIARAKKVIIHERYGSTNLPDHDIAMIILEKAVSVTPICLASESKDFYYNKEALIIGYGTTKYNNREQPANLMKAHIQIYSDKQCRESGIGERLADQTFCAGNLDGGVDSCQGDSGGPMMVIVKGVYQIVGIVSYGEGCGRKYYPGVYTDCTAQGFLGWIKKNGGNIGYIQQSTNQVPQQQRPSRRPSPFNSNRFPPSFYTSVLKDDDQQISNYINMLAELQQEFSRPRRPPPFSFPNGRLII